MTITMPKLNEELLKLLASYGYRVGDEQKIDRKMPDVVRQILRALNTNTKEKPCQKPT